LLQQHQEVAFEWRAWSEKKSLGVYRIPFELFMNNYLGPDAQTVISKYKSLYGEKLKQVVEDHLPFS